MSILVFLVFGFVVGLIARAIMPGTPHAGIVKTTLIGVAGSFIGGLLGNLISGNSIFASPAPAGSAASSAPSS